MCGAYLITRIAATNSAVIGIDLRHPMQMTPTTVCSSAIAMSNLRRQCGQTIRNVGSCFMT
jgi:hypothetical protein